MIGSGESVEFAADISNRGEDAFETRVYIQLPSSMGFINIYNVNSVSQSSLTHTKHNKTTLKKINTYENKIVSLSSDHVIFYHTFIEVTSRVTVCDHMTSYNFRKLRSRVLPASWVVLSATWGTRYQRAPKWNFPSDVHHNT